MSTAKQRAVAEQLERAVWFRNAQREHDRSALRRLCQTRVHLIRAILAEMRRNRACDLIRAQNHYFDSLNGEETMLIHCHLAGFGIKPGVWLVFKHSAARCYYQDMVSEGNMKRKEQRRHASARRKRKRAA